MADAKQSLEQFQFSFDEADTNKSGTLTADEVCKVIVAQGGTEQEARGIFNFMDKDKNTAVSKKEFSDAIASLPQFCREEFKLRKLFRSMDLDNSGSLTIDEIFTSATTQSGITPSQMNDFLTFLRTDVNNKVDYEEFLRVLNKEGTVCYLRELFRKLDKDNSGFLTRGEITKKIESEARLKTLSQKLQELLPTFATDDDQKLNYNEFLEAWKKQNQ